MHVCINSIRPTHTKMRARCHGNVATVIEYPYGQIGYYAIETTEISVTFRHSAFESHTAHIGPQIDAFLIDANCTPFIASNPANSANSTNSNTCANFQFQATDCTCGRCRPRIAEVFEGGQRAERPEPWTKRAKRSPRGAIPKSTPTVQPYRQL